MSRGAYPKHLLPLIGDKTLLQQTVERLMPFSGGPALIVTNADHAFLVSRQLDEIGVGVGDCKLIVEPVARGTAPAAALAVLDVAAETPDGIILIAPSDHLILRIEEFEQAVAAAARLAEAGHISTIGVTATAPESGYGYIMRGDALGEDGYKVDRFVEKPGRVQAEALIATGRVDWNSGIFVARASTLLDEMALHAPNILAAVRASMEAAQRTEAAILPEIECFRACPGNSIDYAVMEKTERAAVVPGDLGWSDLGSWSALWQVSEDQDGNGNVLIGDVAAVDTTNCYVRASGNLVAAVGVENLVIVATDDAVVVAARDRSEDIKSVVDQLRIMGRREVLTNRTEQHPWGTATLLEDRAGTRIRRLSLQPGNQLTEILDGPRLFNWMVLGGTGEVRTASGFADLRGQRHSLVELGGAREITNTGVMTLEILEVEFSIESDEIPIPEKEIASL